MHQLFLDNLELLCYNYTLKITITRWRYTASKAAAQGIKKSTTFCWTPVSDNHACIPDRLLVFTHPASLIAHPCFQNPRGLPGNNPAVRQPRLYLGHNLPHWRRYALARTFPAEKLSESYAISYTLLSFRLYSMLDGSSLHLSSSYTPRYDNQPELASL
jgi:hypothetical protein